MVMGLRFSDRGKERLYEDSHKGWRGENEYVGDVPGYPDEQ